MRTGATHTLYMSVLHTSTSLLGNIPSGVRLQPCRQHVARADTMVLHLLLCCFLASNSYKLGAGRLFLERDVQVTRLNCRCVTNTGVASV